MTADGNDDDNNKEMTTRPARTSTPGDNGGDNVEDDEAYEDNF